MSMSMMSPSIIFPMLPPAAASGEICPMLSPEDSAAEASVCNQGTLRSEMHTLNIRRWIKHLLHAGAPLGPSCVITTQSPLLTLPPRIASQASSCESNTFAGPLNFHIEGSTPAVLTTQPSCAMLPKQDSQSSVFCIGMLYVAYATCRAVGVERIPLFVLRAHNGRKLFCQAHCGICVPHHHQCHCLLCHIF